jgi:hypothetical protein
MDLRKCICALSLGFFIYDCNSAETVFKYMMIHIHILTFKHILTFISTY